MFLKKTVNGHVYYDLVCDYREVTKLIDYIFVSKSNKIKVLKYAILSDAKDLKYPSDHLPVYAELSIKK